MPKNLLFLFVAASPLLAFACTGPGQNGLNDNGPIPLPHYVAPPPVVFDGSFDADALADVVDALPPVDSSAEAGDADDEASDGASVVDAAEEGD